MFFIASKTLGLLALPSHLIVLLGIAGVLLLPTQWSRAGRRMMAVSLLLIAIVGVAPVGNVFIRMLEDRFPSWSDSGPPPTGFIILGGMIDPDLSAARGQAVFSSSVERLTVVPTLARRYPQARIVFSGGNGSLIPGGASEAEVALPVLESFGIPRDRITVESRSRTTAENAIYTAELVKPQPGERWVLVTSAFHMPRSVGAFRRAGFPVEAYPVDWQTFGTGDDYLPSGSIVGGLGRLDLAAHEWIGLIAYRLSWRTDTLFPAP